MTSVMLGGAHPERENLATATTDPVGVLAEPREGHQWVHIARTRDWYTGRGGWGASERLPVFWWYKRLRIRPPHHCSPKLVSFNS